MHSMNMENMALKCTLCCDRTFCSKVELLKHLTNILENITCPICNNKWSSVAHLIEHLTLDDCQPDKTKTCKFIVIPDEGNNEHKKTILLEHVSSDEQAKSLPSSSKPTVELPNDGSVQSKMYAELRRQLLKPSSQSNELKFLNDGGITKYVIVAEEEEDVDIEPGVKIVTKQNNDGTISLTTVSEMKVDPEPLEAPESQETEESSEEIYSCNTCGVSFTSVLEHIQNYHNDQDVVVEDASDDPEALPDEMPSADLVNPMESQNTEKQAPRRMITETGDIVEEAVYYSTTTEDTNKLNQTNPVQENVGKGKANNRRLISTESVIKQVEKLSETNGPYHKVVIKELTVQGGERVKVFNCVICNIYVSSLDEFKTHPCTSMKYSCPHCPVAYENSKSLCAHMKVHKNRPGSDAVAAPVSFECEVCNTIFLTNKSLKLHKRMHDPVKSRPIEAPVENEKSNENGLETKFLCSICNKVMPIEYRSIHQKSHQVEEKYNCDICNKKFQSGEYLEMHMNVHTLDKAPINKQDKSLPYTCLYCDRRFARPHEKVKHERIHTGERPHSCEICGKSFRVAYCLTLHMRTHTGARPYACPHCNKRFKAHSVYNHHLMTHSEVRAYKCPYCPKAFKTSVQLAGHKNSHTKPFSCQHCNRPFASLYAVRVHTETHLRQNNLKFACSMCGATYARAFALKDHIKKVHNKEAEKADIKTSTLELKSNVVELKWAPVKNQTEGENAMETFSKDVPQDEMNELGIIDTKYSNLIIP